MVGSISELIEIYDNLQQEHPSGSFGVYPPSSEFAVKSAYNAIRCSNLPSHPIFSTSNWKSLWTMKIQARLKNLDRKHIFKLYMEHKEKGWKPPPKNWVKLNFDAAIRVDKTIIALIARNEKRKLLLVRTEQFKPSNPLLEEAKAALFVVKKYVKEGFNNIVIEGDPWNFIDWLRSPYAILH
uniref:RNase H type-1 domain-containing protein n=1 Tax=Quercus lobata TaxID=97700 RepID=A0A7N2LLL8_QUELO